MSPAAARRLRLALAAIWLIDAALQFQPYMFTRAFGHTLAASAQGNPRVIAGPITWSAGIIQHQPAVTNAAFALVQLLIAVGIAWRPAVKYALAASVVWSVAVWWLGEGLGGVLTGSASPWTGAPGAVIIYALLAVLLWPAERDASASFVAGRPLGRLPARLLWLVLWGGMAFLALQSANMAPHGQRASALLAIVFQLIAGGIFLPAACARVAVVMAAAASAVIWIVGEDFGAIFTGSSTDLNSGLLLGLLAVAYWPAGAAARAGDGKEVAGASSVTISMASHGHSTAQMPQPLQ